MDTHPLLCPVILVPDMSIDQRKERAVSSDADVRPWVDLRTVLPHEDASCLCKLATEYLYTKPLARAVSSVS